jgi:hypothetical protein
MLRSCRDIEREAATKAAARLADGLETARLRAALGSLLPLLTDERGHCRVCDARRHQESDRADCPFAALSAPPPAGSPELLAALEVGRLRAAAADALSGWRYIRERYGDLDGVWWQRVEDGLRAALSAPPPDLGPLRDLVAAVQEECDAWNNASPDGPPERLSASLAAALAAYPFLGDPECE